jgi:MFS transporter, putative metabolite:H+ symporter
MRLVVGSTNFSDAFDSLTIAYVLPAIIPLWHLAPADIGALISIGYAGQVVGSLLSGWLADNTAAFRFWSATSSCFLC